MHLNSPKLILLLSAIIVITGANLFFTTPTAATQPPASYTDVSTCRTCHQAITDSFIHTAHYFDSRPADSNSIKGSFEEGLALLAAGDSATFFINADTLFAKMMQPLPPMIKKGSEITFTVKVLSVLTSEEFQKQQTEAGVKQKAVDEKVIQDYLAKNNLTAKAQHTASGLYYVDEVVGTGETPSQGDNVKVHYTGKLLDGKVFDSSKNTGKPIDFQVGVGMVIPGWEEGIMMMKKGGKRTLIIPSGLAYGVDGSPGAIPGNSVLLFDVELIDFTKGAKPATPPMPAPTR